MISRTLLAEVRPTEKVKLLVVDIDGFREIAPKLAFGSVCVFNDLPETSKPEVEKIGDANEFRWFNPNGLAPNQVSLVKARYDTYCYGTHEKYLLQACKETTGDVIELGAGDGSTRVLHDLMKDQDRVLYTVDNSMEWLSKFSKELATPRHVFVLDPDPAQVLKRLSIDKHWGVVFVDHAPGQTRNNAIMTASGCADYVVVHDTEELGYGYERVLSTFKYRKDFRLRRPWTTVLSNVREIFSDPWGEE